MDKQKIASILTDLKQSLLEDLERGAMGSETVTLEQNKVGRLSRMDAMQQQEMHKASQHLIRRRLGQIEKALQALASGDYGFCEACGDDIAASRLQVRPESLMCVSCQEKLERR
ncbi:MAG: TraR/DksA family transcriptional regulator [Pseudohongiellaceae bacterium]